MNTIKKNLKKHRIELRNRAELGFKEWKTKKYIESFLDKLEIKYETIVETGIIGKIKGIEPKKTIAFRADMDGLETGEKVKHLCGHDSHMSILLGLIEFLSKNKDRVLDDIVFLFQPAEEAPGGAKPIIESKILDKYKVDEIYGLHIFPELEQGKLASRKKHFLSANAEVDIKIQGKSGHGALPQNSIDSIVAGSQMITALQSIVSRSISPIDQGVLTIGKINAGTRRNIIAENFEMQGTLRAFKKDVYEKIKSRIFEVAKGISEMFNVDVNVFVKDDYPSVINDEILFEEAKEILKKDLIEIQPLMISEDFSYYQENIPGLFFLLGSKNTEKNFTSSLHSINFDYDEDVLLQGLNYYIRLLEGKNSINSN